MRAVASSTLWRDCRTFWMWNPSWGWDVGPLGPCFKALYLGPHFWSTLLYECEHNVVSLPPTHTTMTVLSEVMAFPPWWTFFFLTNCKPKETTYSFKLLLSHSFLIAMRKQFIQ